MKQNITLSLERNLIKRARALAAQRSSSISRMLGEALARMVHSAEERERAKRRALSHLDSGFRLGGIAAVREKLHER